MHTSSSETGSIRAGSSSRTWVRVALAVLLTLTWLAVAGIGGPYFGKISEVSTNSQTDFLPASAESTQVVEQQGDFLGTDAVPAILVFEADGSPHRCPPHLPRGSHRPAGGVRHFHR